MIGYRIAAVGVLAVHLIFILWLIFGYVLGRKHRFWRWLHIGCLIWGVVIEIAPWPCPLTILETRLEANGGIEPYRQPVLVHYLEAILYPNIPESVLIAMAAIICLINVSLYARRFKKG